MSNTNNPLETYLDKYFLKDVQAEDFTILPPRKIIRIIGASTPPVDNPANGSTDITVGGGGGGGGGGFTPTADTAVAVGDATVNAATGTAHIKRAIASTLAAAPGAQGIVTVAASPSAQATVQTNGNVDPTKFNLGGGAASQVVLDPIAGRPVRASLPRGHEAFLGTCDTHGVVTVAPRQFVGTTPRHVVNICDPQYGAVPDFGCAFFTGDPRASSTHITGYPSNTFPATAAGKSAVIWAGVGGITDLRTTIVSVDAGGTGVVIANAITFGGTFGRFTISWGTDNTATIQAAHDAAFDVGHTMHIPWGHYFFLGQLRFKEGVCITGDSPGGADVTTGGGSRLIYGNNGTAILVAPSTLGADTGPAMATLYENWGLGNIASDSQVGIEFNDCYAPFMRNFWLLGSVVVGGATASIGGFNTAGVILKATSINTAFAVFEGCGFQQAAGDGIQCQSGPGAVIGVVILGGSMQGCGAWGLNSHQPVGGAPAPSIHLVGVDTEGTGLGGITGWYNVLTVKGCYEENGFEPFISITGSQFALSVTLEGNTISRWGGVGLGGRSYPMLFATSAGIQTLVLESNYSPFTGTGLTNPTAMALVSGCKHVRIGPNQSYLPLVDIGGLFDQTVDIGAEEVTYTAVMAITTGTSVTGVPWDSAGLVTALKLARRGGIKSLRAWLTAAPTSGQTWQVKAYATDTLTPRSGSPFKITGVTTGSTTTYQTDGVHPVQNGTEVTILGTLTGVSGAGAGGANGSATRIDDHHFSLPLSSSGTWTAGGTVQAFMRDTGLLTSASDEAETFTDASGNATFRVEEQRLLEGSLLGLKVSAPSGAGFPASTALVMELTVAYRGKNGGSSEIGL